MVRVSFSTTVAADSSSQYDGDSADSEPEKADGVRREGPGLTAARSNGKEGRAGCFRRRTRIGNDALWIRMMGVCRHQWTDGGGGGVSWKRGEEK